MSIIVFNQSHDGSIFPFLKRKSLLLYYLLKISIKIILLLVLYIFVDESGRHSVIWFLFISYLLSVFNSIFVLRREFSRFEQVNSEQKGKWVSISGLTNWVFFKSELSLMRWEAAWSFMTVPYQKTRPVPFPECHHS